MTESISSEKETTTKISWNSFGQIRKVKAVQSSYLVAIFIILIGIGMANLYSAANDTNYFHTQLRHSLIAATAFIIVGWVLPIRIVRTYATPFYAFIVLSLMVVMVLGHTAGGSQRWLNFGGTLRFQPSEFAKISVAIIVSKWFYVNKLPHPYRLRDLWPVILKVGAIFGLIFLQPDFGTAGICLIIAAIQTLFVRLNVKSVAIVFISGIVSAVVGWSFFLHSYQKLRILNFLNPSLDPTGSGYNSLQSLVAVGSGNMFGKGYLLGSQTQLQFLPARHTDFIFSVFAEEHGFIGGAIIFFFFGLLAFVSLEIARQARDSFSGLLAIGLAAFIFIEFTINVAMVLGIFPVVGMPLPLFSYGGSSLLTVSIAIGMLIAIDRDNVGLGRQNKSLKRPALL
ncbi:MAG: rod shape-determining protein RodA [Bdellovibrionota bacterium]